MTITTRHKRMTKQKKPNKMNGLTTGLFFSTDHKFSDTKSLILFAINISVFSIELEVTPAI